MRCAECDGPLRVLRTYEAGEHGRTRDLKCEDCGVKVTSVEVLWTEQGYGNGGEGMASALKKRRAQVNVRKT